MATLGWDPSVMATIGLGPLGHGYHRGVGSPSFQSRARAGLLAAAILLLASNLRAAITAVGPLVGEIRADEGISHGLAGLITTLPLLAFAALSSLAPRIARRFGIERTLLASMVVLVVGILLRSSGPLAALFGGTALLGLAIAAGNVLLPGLIKRDFPDRTGWMTGLYSGAMGVTATVAVALAVPVADRAGLGWRGSLAYWAAPAAVAALVWLPLAHRSTRPTSPPPGIARGADDAPAGNSQVPRDAPARNRRMPCDAPASTAQAVDAAAVGNTNAAGDAPAAGNARGAGDAAVVAGSSGSVPSLWRSGLAWQVTIFMGLQSLVFYSTIAWLAEILRDRGLSSSAAGWLVSVAQFSGLVTSLAVPPIATRRASQRVHVTFSALLSLAGYSGLLLSGRGLLPLWCVLIGLGQGALFSLALTMFALRAPDARHAAELSGMAQTVGYLLAATGPTVLGPVHDLTGAWTVPLAALAATTVAILIAGLAAGRDALVAARAPSAAQAAATHAARASPGHRGG
jgi:MFS transporter, CP family, cyanate transporter